jgi:hypothetical protein
MPAIADKGTPRTKAKTLQRAIIVLKDHADDSFTADLSFEPSIKSRKETTPAMRAAYRIANLIVEQRERLIADLPHMKSAAGAAPQIIITDAGVPPVPPKGRTV